jgi:alpha-1,3/alpha-1,6-mannosyltransferase
MNHDTTHCFNETQGDMSQHETVLSGTPRAWGMLRTPVVNCIHLLISVQRQGEVPHLPCSSSLAASHLSLRPGAYNFDVYFVDQLSTCIRTLRRLTHKDVLFCVYSPDRLIANGEF